MATSTLSLRPVNTISLPKNNSFTSTFKPVLSKSLRKERREVGQLKVSANKNFAKEVGELVVADKQLETERYIASNRFRVKAGKEAAFEKRWAERKSRLAELDGFRFFYLLRRVAGNEDEALELKDEEPNYASLTVWENKETFNAWRTGEAFKEAHGGGTIWGFISMLVSSSQTLEDRPSPAFYHGLLPLQGPDTQVAGAPWNVKDGWRQVTADGINPIEPDCFVAMNRFQITEGNEEAFEARWANRESKLNEMPGFVNFIMLRRDAIKADDGFNYVSCTTWKDRAAFQNWRDSQNFQSAHGQKPTGATGAGGPPPSAGKPAGGPPSGGMMAGPPQVAFYEGKLALNSEVGI